MGNVWGFGIFFVMVMMDGFFCIKVVISKGIFFNIYVLLNKMYMKLMVYIIYLSKNVYI